MEQMAGILEDYPPLHGPGRPRGTALRQEFAHVLNALGEPCGARIVGQELAVVLEHGAAAGGVDDDRGVAVEGVEILAGQLASAVSLPGMELQGSAADLPLGKAGLAAERRQQLGRVLRGWSKGGAH